MKPALIILLLLIGGCASQPTIPRSADPVAKGRIRELYWNRSATRTKQMPPDAEKLVALAAELRIGEFLTEAAKYHMDIGSIRPTHYQFDGVMTATLFFPTDKVNNPQGIKFMFVYFDAWDGEILGWGFDVNWG